MDKMNTNKKKKITLYNKFSKNLDHIKKHLGINFGEEHPTDSYICPLSFGIFTRDGLDDKFTDQLTVEHAPPLSFKGKKVALTTKTLNNESGYSYDIDLQNHINFLEFKEGSSRLPTKFKINKKISINGEVSNKPQLGFHFKPKFMHHGAESLINILKNQETFHIDFQIPNPPRPDFGLLRIAYLLAFSELGYGFLFGGSHIVNPNTCLIREQLLNSKNNSIPAPVIFKEDFSDDFLGANIIHSPKEFRSVLVVFDLETKNQKHRFGVVLPGPDNYGFKVYDYIRTTLKSQKTIKFDSYTFPKKLDLENYDDSIHFLKMWNDLNGIERD